MERLPYLSMQEHVQCSEHWADHTDRDDGEQIGDSLHNWASSDTEFTLHVQWLQTEFFQKKSMLLYFSPACSIREQQMPPATLSAPLPFIHMTFEVTIDNPRMASLDSSNLPSAENKHC